MFKRIGFVLLLLFSAVCVFAQSDVSQMILPKRLYVGDIGELHYKFNSAIDFFSGETLNEEKQIPLSSLPYDIDNKDFTIEKVTLNRVGSTYILVITFIPWRTGVIDFQKFDFLKVMFGTSTVPFEIDPEPFEVLSILQNGEDTNLRPAQAPLLIPGTMYVVYGIILIALFIIITLIRLFVIRSRLYLLWKQKKTLKLYAKNARRTLRHLKKLYKRNEKFTDIEYCKDFQHILRNYLKVRFDANFLSLATSQFVQAFSDATGGFLSDKKWEKINELTGLFIRCDYIRFAHLADLDEGERLSFVEKAREVVSCLEEADERVKEEENA